MKYDIHKPLPQAVDMERATIGAVLMNPAVMPAAAAILTSADDMYDQRHNYIWSEMLECWQTQTPPDLKLVSEGLRRKGKLENIGGILYLSDLTDHAPSSSSVGHYAQAVAAAAVRRRTIDASGNIARLGFDEALPLEELPAKVQSEIDSAITRIARRSGISVEQLMSAKWESLYEERRPGVCTGFRDLDEMFGGLQRSDLIILAARPAVGKTSFAISIADQVARDNRRVEVYSLEMSAEQLGDRLIAMRTGIDTQRIRLRMIRSDSDRQAIAEAMSDLAKLNMRIEDDGALTITELRARAIRNASIFGPPDLIIIDYLQLMGGGGDDDNRVQEVSKISRGLKQLARELNVPIIALSQLSRSVESRTSKVPMLSDLRESGSIEQDADVVMFIYREELYEPETDKKGIAEIHVAKHRNGPVGVVPMRFDASTTKFSTLSYRLPEGY